MVVGVVMEVGGGGGGGWGTGQRMDKAVEGGERDEGGNSRLDAFQLVPPAAKPHLCIALRNG